MNPAASPAGPSRHRRTQTTENWDDDFEFAPPARPARTSRDPSISSSPSSQSRYLTHSSGESKANRSGGHGRSNSKTAAVIGQAKEGEVEEDWDAGGSWDDKESVPLPSSIPSPPSRTSIQMRRGSKGPAPLILPSSSSSSQARTLGPPRSSPSSTSPLPSPPGRPSSSKRQISSSSSYLRAPLSPEAGPSTESRIRRHPSASFSPAPTTATVAVTNDSSASLASWTKFNRYSPNLPPIPLAEEPPAAGPSRGTMRDQRELRHMKSGDIMPPPPVPSLMRRKSKRDQPSAQSAEVREIQVPFSPSMDQLKELEGKRGFWKRLSGNTSGMGKGSPTPTESSFEHRRRRSSSTGSRSPTKIRPNLSPAEHPPLPPLPDSVRSPSAASSASATSMASASSQNRPSGLAGILRRSTSSLIRNQPKEPDPTGQNTPPSSYTSPVQTYNSAMPIPIRTSSRSSQMSISNSGSFASDLDGRGKRKSSISQGYHLPSPAIGSPYRKSGYFSPPEGEVPPLPHSASYNSGRMTHGAGGGSVTSTDTESEVGEGDAQITPKRQRKVRPASSHKSSSSVSRPPGWGGEGWSGFPSSSVPPPAGAPPASVNPNRFPLPPSRTTSHSSSRIPSSASSTRPDGQGLAVAEDTETETSRSFSTLRRLSSLSKKHGRRISGGWKFGTGSSTSTNSSTEEKRGKARLETVVGSPVKVSPGTVGRQRLGPNDEYTPEGREGAAVPKADGVGAGEKDRNVRGGSVSAPNSILKPPLQSARDLNAEWDRLGVANAPASTGMKTTMSVLETRIGQGVARSDKERRRQSWNDFVIPKNVLEKQKELRKGIEGVKRFAGGVEALKSLLETHSTLNARLSSTADPYDLIAFSELDREFSQWWEMATVLIEVGSTGQAPMSPPEDDSPKRTRRVTLASDEAKLAADMMRRSQSYQTPFTSAAPSGLPGTGKELRKISLPDPQDVSLLGGGPPRASPDLWRASTGRQELSKRQLEVLRTMLRTPVSDSSVPSSRNDGLRGMSTISSSSTSASVAEKDKAGGKAVQKFFRPPISRAATTDSRVSDTASVHFGSPGPVARSASTAGQQHRTVTPTARPGEMFPSPDDSAYIVPSQSFPSPITASQLAFGNSSRPGLSTDPIKMRRGSKVGLAGLKEFIKGLKSKDSKKDLKDLKVVTQAIERANRPPPLTTPGLPRTPDRPMGSAVPLSPTSLAKKYPFALRHRGTPSIVDLHQASRPGASPGLQQPRRGSDQSSFVGDDASPLRTPTRPTEAGPPVSGKKRRRPGLRGIFRAGSGSWSDLVREGEKRPRGSRENTGPPISGMPYPRVGSGGSTESAPSPVLLRHSPSVGHLAGGGMRSTSGPSRLSVQPIVHTPQVSPESGGRGHAEEDTAMMTVRPSRKSRIMGLGWPEEAAAAREMERLGSGATFASTASGASGISDQQRQEGSWHDEPREEEEGGEDEEEEDVTIALTPESLPVLLEYLRQCEGKLGEWRERVRALERK